MRKDREARSEKKGRSNREEKGTPSRSKARSGKGEGKKARGKARSEEASEGESDYAALANAILDEEPIPTTRPKKFRRAIEKVFWEKDKAERIRIRKKYKTYERWQRKSGKDNDPGVRYEDFRAKVKVDNSGKRVAKESRVKEAAPVKRDQFIVLLKPLTIVANNPLDKSVIADAGTIVQRCDSAPYRDLLSPITHRGDEWLVRYGKADKPKYGWLSVHASEPKAVSVAKGPAFLVTSSNEESVSVWDAFRLKIGRARKADPSEWLVTWMARNGAKYPKELRSLVREFDGKPIKNEGFEVRCVKVFKLILKQEIDVESVKSAKRKKAKKAGKKVSLDKLERTGKKAKVSKTTTAKSAKPKSVSFDRITKAHDAYVIKRLIQENPRRAGSNKAKIWDKLKKGMTVEQFVAKGGKRAIVGYYIKNGWIKLLRPKGDTE